MAESSSVERLQRMRGELDSKNRALQVGHPHACPAPRAGVGRRAAALRLTARSPRARAAAPPCCAALLQSQVVELLRSSCPQLVQNAKSVCAMAELGASAHGHAESLRGCVGALPSQLDEVLAAAQGAIGRREANMALLRQQAALLELFEVPSLMDTCIRSGLIDEARAPPRRAPRPLLCAPR